MCRNGKMLTTNAEFLRAEISDVIRLFEAAPDVYHHFIYENGRLSAELKQMQICMTKADEYIMQLNRK